jgi:hypothetical protein
MLHALQPAQLRRMDKNQLKTVAEHCERALLAGISTHQDMMTLIEVEKELLRRERIDTKQQMIEVRASMVGRPTPGVSTTPNLPSVTSSVILAPSDITEIYEEHDRLELLPVAPNRY